MSKLNFKIDWFHYARAGIASNYIDAWERYPDLFPPSHELLPDIGKRRADFYHNSGMRPRLVEAMRAAYRRLDLGDSPLLQKLADQHCMVVVSGQQAGLLSGPLYTIYKILGSIRLAESLDSPTIPVFWNAAEDSDLDEIRQCQVPGQDGTPAIFDLDLSQFPKGTMAACVPANALDMETFTEWWKENLRATDFSADCLALISDTWQKSNNLGDWMSRLIHHWFGDRLLVVDPSWPELKPLGLDLVERELENPTATAQEVNVAGKALAEVGLEPRIHRPDDRASIFYVRDGIRHNVRWSDGKLHTMERALSVAEFMTELREEPDRYSSGATFRPLLQDTLLPTLAVCLGPGELAYHCQLEAEYQRLEVPRPAVVMRPSLTLLEPPAQKRLEKLGLEWSELLRTPEALGKALAGGEEGADIKTMLDDLRSQTDTTFNSLRKVGQGVDPTIVKALEKQGKNLDKTLRQIEDLFMRRLSNRNSVRLQQLQALRGVLFPDGKPQERCVSIFYFLNKYGPGFALDLLRALPVPGERTHGLARWELERQP
jgi:bacillithiol synthase